MTEERAGSVLSSEITIRECRPCCVMGNAIRPANDLVSLPAVLRSRRPGACANVFCAELGAYGLPAYGLPGACCWPLLSNNGGFGEAFSEAQNWRQEVGQVNSSEEACEQSSDTAEWVERSDLTERKLG